MRSRRKSKGNSRLGSLSLFSHLPNLSSFWKSKKYWHLLFSSMRCWKDQDELAQSLWGFWGQAPFLGAELCGRLEVNFVALSAAAGASATYNVMPSSKYRVCQIEHDGPAITYESQIHFSILSLHCFGLGWSWVRSNAETVALFTEGRAPIQSAAWSFNCTCLQKEMARNPYSVLILIE